MTKARTPSAAHQTRRGEDAGGCLVFGIQAQGHAAGLKLGYLPVGQPQLPTVLEQKAAEFDQILVADLTLENTGHLVCGRKAENLADRPLGQMMG